MPASDLGELSFASASLHRLYLAMRPGRAEHTLLQACLLQGEAAAVAWRRWLLLSGDPLDSLRRDRVGVKRHLPRLYANLSGMGCDISRKLEPYLRTAVAREQMRHRRFLAALTQALAALTAAGIDTTLLKGAAMGEVVLGAPWLRHSHDVDIHVEGTHLERAALVLESAGFWPQAGTATAKHRRLDHANGLPICLHAHLLEAEPLGLPEMLMLARRIGVRVADQPVRMLRAEDMLAHVCCHAAVRGSRQSLGWVVDAVTLLRTEGFDARHLGELLHTPAGCLLAPALRVVEDVAPGCVPPSCVDVLLQTQASDDGCVRELLLRAAAVSMGGWALLAGSRGARDRLAVLALLWGRLPGGLLRATRKAWHDPRFTHLRRHPWLHPLRRGYLSLKPVVAPADESDAVAQGDRSWRERGLL